MKSITQKTTPDTPVNVPREVSRPIALLAIIRWCELREVPAS